MSSPTLQEVPHAKIRLSTGLIRKISRSSKKKGLFWNEGQLQVIFRRIMRRGQKLELRLGRSGILSWVPLGQTADCFREVYG